MRRQAQAIAGTQGSIDDASGHAQPLRDASAALLFGDDRDQQGHINVSVQVQLHLVFACDANWTCGHAHFAAADGLTRLDRGFRDIGGTDRAEELAFRTGLGFELELEALELHRARLRCGQFLARFGFQLVALRFAGDAELPELVREILEGKLQTGKQIKLRVKNWQPDWLRA